MIHSVFKKKKKVRNFNNLNWQATQCTVVDTDSATVDVNLVNPSPNADKYCVAVSYNNV
jgi:hypothetical protein